VKAFLSSTYRDLAPYRAVATEALEFLNNQVVRMEIFGARPEEPRGASLREVQKCDIFIGIYAHRYGVVPRGDSLSITEQEFDEARRLRKAIFCFVVADDHPWPPSKIEMEEPARLRLVKFKEKIKETTTCATFTDLKDLQAQIAMSIAHYLGDKGSDVTEPGRAPDLTDLVDRAIDLLRRITKTDYNQIFLLGRVESDLNLRPIEVAYYISTRKLRYRIASLDGLIGSVLETGKQINADAVRDRSNYLQAVVETRSELIVPISSNGIIAGVFNSESEIEEYYTDAICAEVEQLAGALGPMLPQVGWHPGIQFTELPHVSRSLD
jgi:putative methionine-R-sulfoxide reductase with GAF domain